eukprot:5554137-Pyramimonas_sp.AAC.1
MCIRDRNKPVADTNRRRGERIFLARRTIHCGQEARITAARVTGYSVGRVSVSALLAFARTHPPSA